MNYYEFLKVPKNASTQEIRDSYKLLIKQYHPDIYKGNQKFAEQYTQTLNDAYDTLSNPEKRAAYDLTLKENYMNFENTIHTSTPKYYSTYSTNNINTNTYSNHNTYSKHENPPYRKKSWNQLFKNKIYNIVDKKTQKMSKQTKILFIILIILLASFFTMLSLNDFINFVN